MRGPSRPRRGTSTTRWSVVVIVAAVFAALAASGQEPAPARVLVIDSYHPGYPWGDGIRRGIADVFGCDATEGVCRTDDGRYLVRFLFLDTKRRPEADWIAAAAAAAADTIASWRPDAVITCDDNAVASVTVPHLLGTDLPVVFCGVNYDASVYGLPAQNVTGMIEVDQTADLVAVLRPHARGDRVGLLVLDTTSGRRDAEVLQTSLERPVDVRLVASYDQWKETFAAMQDDVDMLLVKQNVTGLPDWDLLDAIAFTAANTRIPTGTTTEGTMECVLVSFIKNAAEQGLWAARAVERILAGTPPEEIPLAVNKESRVFLNMQLARSLGVQFPIELLDRATFLEER